MRIRQLVLVLGLALLFALALPALARSDAASSSVAPEGNAAPALKTRALNGTELAILRIKAQLAVNHPERANGKNKRLLLSLAAWCLSKWTAWHGGCTYGNNCGGTCSTAVYGSGLKIFGLLSPWQKRVVDDLDDMCYQHDTCRYQQQQQQSPSSGVCSDVMGCQTEIKTCDKPLYDRCQSIIVACPWWTLCYWARKTAAAVAIKQAMAARLLWAGVNVQV